MSTIRTPIQLYEAHAESLYMSTKQKSYQQYENYTNNMKTIAIL